MPRPLRPFARRARDRLFRGRQEIAPDNTQAWLGAAFTSLMRDAICAKKPWYVWGVLQGAVLARVLEIDGVSVLEFGVAGGAGLLSLERTASRVEELVDVRVDVYGFDSGVGLPEPTDYRDQPNMWFQGQLPMRREALDRLLDRASLRLGLVGESVPPFLEEKPSPIAFAAFDLDLYSSTCAALAVFDGPEGYVLPRVPCYFDDILGHTYNDYAGERLAIAEFNERHAMRKISQIYGLEYFVPPKFKHIRQWNGMFFAHFFDHPLYCAPDSYEKTVYVDESGVPVCKTISSDWRSEVLGPTPQMSPPAS